MASSKPNWIRNPVTRARSLAKQSSKQARCQLVFLPYLTPEFPENQGRIEIPLNSREEAIELFNELHALDLIEEAKIYKPDGWTETLL